MNIVYYSRNNKLNHHIGWTKGCKNISYESTSTTREHNEDSYYHCLHFEYKSPYKNDVITFANSFPYSLIDLEKFFNRILLKRTISSLKIDKIKVA